MHTKFWSKNLKGSDHLEDLGVDGEVWTRGMWIRIWTSGGSCEHGGGIT
jgi:hypothetical protein